MIKVCFFASLRESLGTNEMSISATSLLTVNDVKNSLISQNPSWKTHLDSELILHAVNHHMVDASHNVKQGDEVAFFPPVTGG